MIHSGAVVAAGVSQGRSTSLKKDFKVCVCVTQQQDVYLMTVIYLLLVTVNLLQALLVYSCFTKVARHSVEIFYVLKISQ